MAEILAPGLELLRGAAQLLAELDQSVAEGVRIEVRQPYPWERLPKDLSYRLGISPKALLEPLSLERQIFVLSNLRSGEDGVVVAGKASPREAPAPGR